MADLGFLEFLKKKGHKLSPYHDEEGLTEAADAGSQMVLGTYGQRPNIPPQPPRPKPWDHDQRAQIDPSRRVGGRRGLGPTGAENRSSAIGPEGQKMPVRRTTGTIGHTKSLSDVRDPAARRQDYRQDQQSQLDSLLKTGLNSVFQPDAMDRSGRLTDEDVKRIVEGLANAFAGGGSR